MNPTATGNGNGTALSPRGARRREAIIAAAASLFAERGYAAVGIDDIGAAAGITGPAIYRHFDSKAAVLTAVLSGIIDVVSGMQELPHQDSRALLQARIRHYASGVAERRELMAVFVREVHHLPTLHAEALRQRQRELVTAWRSDVSVVHPDWSPEYVRTSVHAVFGMLNAVGTFSSPLSDDELASELVSLAVRALALPDDAP